MSGIPERLWRVLCGHWEMMKDRTDETQAMADAYAELAEQLRASRIRLPADASRPGVLPPPAPDPAGGKDPLAVSYALLQVEAGVDLAALDAAYQMRLAELAPESYPPGSAQRGVIEGRRKAVIAAYERLRDALNPTETRFEKIEF